MNWMIVTGIFSLLALVLLLLNNWQGKIERARTRRLDDELEAARESGTSQPIAQHPQIDVQACIGCGTCIEACPEEGVLAIVNGVARVVHGSRCIGHGVCAVACPVQAIEIGLGDISGRSDLPLLDSTLQTSVPGVYIAGELGGFALIRLAIEQGVQAIDAIAAELAGTPSRPGVPDVLIVGAGPAGFSATLRCLELGLSYRTIDQDDLGGTIRKYPRRKLTLVGSMSLPLHGPVDRDEFLKEELIEFLEEIRDRTGMELSTGVKLLGLEASEVGVRAETSTGTIEARRALLALGRRGTPRRLGVPGEDAEHVLYQLVDASTYANEKIVVVGGGDSAVEAALGLTHQSNNDVTLVYRREEFFRIKSRNAERLEVAREMGQIEVRLGRDVASIEEDTVTLVATSEGVEHREVVPANYVFVCAGGEPPYPLLESIGVQMGNQVAPVSLEPAVSETLAPGGPA